jgi:hypothetical protein
MWSKIEHPVKSASYGGGTIVPSSIYAAAPLSSSQAVIWSSANPRFASPVFIVKPHIAGQGVIAGILEDGLHRGDSRMFAEQAEAVDWSARQPAELAAIDKCGPQSRMADNRPQSGGAGRSAVPRK